MTRLPSGLPSQLLSVVTVVVLAGLLLLIPRDDCSASVSGTCVEAGEHAGSVRADVGEPARLRTGTITVTKVQVGTGLETSTFDDERVRAPASGRYLVVDYRATLTDRTRSVEAVLTSGGRTFRSHLEEVGYSDPLQPGVAGSGRLGFLLPADALRDDPVLRLSLGNSGNATETPLPKLPVRATIAKLDR